MEYTTQHIQSFFNVSHQTVKNWCDQLESWLSVSARPGKNKQRHFDDQDLLVFSLAQEMLGKGGKYSDVKEALANGKRGQLPETSIELVPSAVSGQVLALRETIQNMSTEIRRLQSDLDRQLGQNDLLERQLQTTQERLEKLIAENAVLKSKGE